MKLGLVKVKHAAFASQETHCFEAVLTIDSVPAFHVSNDGHGGADFYRPLPKQLPEDFRKMSSPK